MKKYRIGIAATDFLLVFILYFLTRQHNPGPYTQWYWLLGMSAIWVALGILTHKLEFWNYSTPSRALGSIAIVNSLIYSLNFVAKNVIFQAQFNIHNLAILLIIILLEIGFYLIWHRIFRTIPILEEEKPVLPERGIEQAPRYTDSPLQNPDLANLYNATKGLGHKAITSWIRAHSSEFSSGTLIDDTGDPAALAPSSGPQPQLLICLRPFNNIRNFNTYLEAANELLPYGGQIALYGETSNMRRERIVRSFPKGLGAVAATVDYLWSRVLSKLALTGKLQKRITRGLHKNLPRVEVLGRVSRAGFDILGDEVMNDFYYVSAVRHRPHATNKPYYGFLVRLPRKGKNGEDIGVFKIRTMYAYSEYIQDYAYKISGLEKGGKIKEDFRVNLIGAHCRRSFVDELPMFLNLMRGDLKLVGVRPLSRQYLSLYTPEMQEMHLSVKPGIFPPLYFERTKPETLEEIQESERRYIERYRENPRRTDWTYFWGIMHNVLIKRERSH